MTNDFEACDFFVDESLFDDPYPYWEYVRATKGPVWIDPRYDVAVVTGHEEETEVLRNHATFSSCNSPTGPFPGLPVKVEGDDADPAICEHRSEMPMHEFMVTMDPPAARRLPEPDVAALHAEADEEERGLHVAARRREDRRVHR